MATQPLPSWLQSGFQIPSGTTATNVVRFIILVVAILGFGQKWLHSPCHLEGPQSREEITMAHGH